jgi:hypothetical protein
MGATLAVALDTVITIIEEQLRFGGNRKDCPYGKNHKGNLMSG